MPFPFLQPPAEVRNLIYLNLLSVSHTRNPRHFTSKRRVYRSFYQWNLHPAILCTNRLIYEEARSVLSRSNDFVVLERGPNTNLFAPGSWEQGEGNVIKDHMPWPGQTCAEAIIPGERMRVRLLERSDEDEGSQDRFSIHVLLL